MKSPLRYSGGKSKVTDQLVAMMPDDLTVICDVTLGGGSILLAAMAAEKAKQYYGSDIDGSLMSFWEDCCETRRSDSMIYDLRMIYQLCQKVPQLPRELHKRNKARLMNGLELSSALYFFQNRVAYSGNLKGGFSQHAAVERFTLSSVERLAELCTAIRKHRFIPQQLTWQYALQNVDLRTKTLIIADPPYPELGDSLYQNSDFDHYDLARSLRHFDQKFLVTYNDCDLIRDLYGNWANITELPVQYSADNVGGKKCKVGKELVIRNYE